MIYEDARKLIRNGDLLAFSHGSWKTWRGIKVNIVRMATRSTYSHVGIACWVDGRVMVLEAVKPKTRDYPLSEYGDFYWLPMDAPWLPTTSEYAWSKVGKVVYSEFWAVVAFFIKLPTGMVRQCAAYVREVFKRDGIDLGDRSTPDAVMLRAQELAKAGLVFVENGDYKE